MTLILLARAHLYSHDKPTIDESVAGDNLSQPIQPKVIDHPLIQFDDKANDVSLLDDSVIPTQARTSTVKSKINPTQFAPNLTAMQEEDEDDKLSVASMPSIIPSTVRQDIKSRLRTRRELPSMNIENRPQYFYNYTYLFICTYFIYFMNI